MLQFCHGGKPPGCTPQLALTSPWSSVEHGRALICLTAATAEGDGGLGEGVCVAGRAPNSTQVYSGLGGLPQAVLKQARG